jgi:hypothetical protein
MRWLLAGALVLTQACALRKPGPPIDESADVVTVNVINHNQLDVTIYVVRSGNRERIGSVTAASSNSFRVHLRTLSGAADLQLFADPLGAPRGVTSDRLHLFPAQTVEWTLESDLARSFVLIR